MELIYRGTAYQAAIAGIEATETTQTGTFLGRSYKMKQTPVAQRQSTHQLTYRGVRYSG
ncbi:hypothetical protein XM38_026300 [Halomicronema hongdechloris C2206]|uniref:DUF4278 domain-containing protein n=1 Tax=Halomicronema hongdechloris C2206 TaxID=1641165 RepID=A0A1Z3HN38_9CYAN|nr:DUF4278 domain-containing protein [Halomicronema hongdechloris]ASC71676.1 hypothetical protein XM38_026300 [Halomicronema hongdechloris C2206]